MHYWIICMFAAFLSNSVIFRISPICQNVYLFVFLHNYAYPVGYAHSPLIFILLPDTVLAIGTFVAKYILAP